MNLQANENDFSGIIEADRAHVWHHLTQHKKFETVDPLIIIEGKGMRVWNTAGREHLDAVSGGVWTVNVGYGRESIADAVRDQLVKLNYFANSAGSIPGAKFAERLIAKMPGMSRVYYSNSGSEANEKAYKIVRQIAHNKHGGKKHKILYRDRDYHGTTITALSSGGQASAASSMGRLRPASSKCRIALNIARNGARWMTTASVPPMPLRRLFCAKEPTRSAALFLSRLRPAAA